MGHVSEGRVGVGANRVGAKRRSTRGARLRRQRNKSLARWRRISRAAKKLGAGGPGTRDSGRIARFSPPGRGPRRRDPGKGPSWIRWGARRPREGARGLRTREEFKRRQMLVGKTWRLQTRRRRGARARGRRSRRGSRQRRARISPRHPRRTRVARRSNPRHGRPSDPPPATSACAGAAPPRGATTTKGLKKLGGRAANAPFFAARTTWTRRTGATRAGVAARTAEPATRARAESTTGVEVIADIVVPNGGLVVSACSLQESARSYCGVIPRWRPPFRMSISVRTGLNRPAQRVNRPWVRVPSR